MKIKNAIAIMALALGFAALSAPAQATSTFGFSYLSNPTDPTETKEPFDLSGQLALDVDFSSGSALLKVRNDGLGGVGSVTRDDWIGSNLAEIYFYSTNRSLFSTFGLLADSGAGVDYTTSKISPPNLPGFDDTGYFRTFAVDNDKCGACGIDAYGEWALFAGVLGNGVTSADILSALTSGDFRVGLHIRSIGGGGSDSYITPLNPVPLPAAAWLFGSALLGFVGFSVRRRV